MTRPRSRCAIAGIVLEAREGMDAWRDLTPEDLPRAAALSAACGWNQVRADWRVFLDHGRARALDDGRPAMLAATAAILPFGKELAWISMVLVRPDRRRAGLATALMRWALEALSSVRCAALDATPEGREVYRRLGFAEGWTFTRFALPDSLPEVAVAPGPPSDAAALDGQALGAPRDALLSHLSARLPEAALSLPGGAAFGRDGRLAAQVGPILAEDAATARGLLSRARSAVAGPLIADLRDGTALAAWAASHGAVPRRSFTRMARGVPPSARDTLIHAVAGPEFG